MAGYLRSRSMFVNQKIIINNGNGTLFLEFPSLPYYVVVVVVVVSLLLYHPSLPNKGSRGELPPQNCSLSPQINFT